MKLNEALKEEGTVIKIIIERIKYLSSRMSMIWK
jgi:hypothetical protein